MLLLANRQGLCHNLNLIQVWRGNFHLKLRKLVFHFKQRMMIGIYSQQSSDISEHSKWAHRSKFKASHKLWENSRENLSSPASPTTSTRWLTVCPVVLMSTRCLRMVAGLASPSQLRRTTRSYWRSCYLILISRSSVTPGSSSQVWVQTTQ